MNRIQASRLGDLSRTHQGHIIGCCCNSFFNRSLVFLIGLLAWIVCCWCHFSPLSANRKRIRLDFQLQTSKCDTIRQQSCRTVVSQSVGTHDSCKNKGEFCQISTYIGVFFHNLSISKTSLQDWTSVHCTLHQSNKLIVIALAALGYLG